MKPSLFILFLVSFFGCSPLAAQDISLQKIWIGQCWNLKFTDSIATLFDRYQPYIYSYKKDGDTLFMGNARRNEFYNYQILKLSADTLILKLLDDKFKRWANRSERVLLIDSSKINYPGFKFEKLVFMSGPCYGTCPWIEMEIDSAGNMFFRGEKYTGEYTGLFEGRLAQDDLKKLADLLQHSWLVYNPANGEAMSNAIDAPQHSLILYYNHNKHKDFNFNISYNRPLLKFLMECYRNAGLKKYDGEHKFDW